MKRLMKSQEFLRFIGNHYTSFYKYFLNIYFIFSFIRVIIVYMMFTPALLSLIGGGLSGFLFQYLANAQQDQQARWDAMLKQEGADDASADAAAKRSNGSFANWTRIIIVLTVLFGVISAPFILTLLNKSTDIQITTPTHTFLGLFSWGGNAKFYQLNGYLMSDEIKQALLALTGFFFGSGTSKRH